MLDSRFLSLPWKMQPIPSAAANSRVIVKRKRLKPGHDLHDGLIGTNEYEWFTVVRGWPCSIVPPHKGDLVTLPPGATERGDFILTSQYKMESDDGLLIRTRDVIIDMQNSLKMLVLWAYDPGNSHLHIVAGLQFGVVNENLDEEQG